VIGPEGPWFALGAGLAFLMVKWIRKMPDTGRNVVAASGSFAAISTLLGTPLAAAFLLMEASGWEVRSRRPCCFPDSSPPVSAH